MKKIAVNFLIAAAAQKAVKEHVNRKGMKLSRWLESAAIEKLEREQTPKPEGK